MQSLEIFRGPTAAVAIVLLGLALLESVVSQTNGVPSEPLPGNTISECRNCPEMIVLPAGSFLMGSPENEPLRRENEKQRRITFAQPFAMSGAPVTWDQWEACVRDAWCDGLAVESALTTLPIAEVALATGFSSQSHLSTWFRRLVGVSPARYRSQS